MYMVAARLGFEKAMVGTGGPPPALTAWTMSKLKNYIFQTQKPYGLKLKLRNVSASTM